VKAFGRNNAAALAADYADYCTVESPSYGRLQGREAVLQHYQRWFGTFPDGGIHPDGDSIIAGDHAAQTLILEGTDTGGFLGQAPTGRPFRLFCVILLTLKDGKIVHERRVYDISGLLLQLAGSPENADAAQTYRATLEAARLENDLRIAAQIQQTLLPARRHSGPRFDIAIASVPCRAIGGDFCDHFELPNEAFAFALGDVSGKGPPAALLAAQLQGILAAHSPTAATAVEVVTRVNEALRRRIVESRFATMFFGRLSSDGVLTYSNAGHNPPLLFNRGGVRRLETGGLVLGAFGHVHYEEEAVRLHEGDVLVVFSDGVTEAMNADGAEFGEERLRSCLSACQNAAAAELLDCVLGTVREFTAGAPQSDDITAMVLRYGPSQRP
jgi:serine phosphatase RsbU (regulator of sigma subunit)